jgi:hypothetical protein
MARRSFLLLAVLSAVVGASEADAQSTLRGRIVRTGDLPVSGAEVAVVGTDQRVFSDSAGAYVLADIASGWQVLLVRKVGFTARHDTVNVRDGRVTNRDITLSATSQLDTVRTIARTTSGNRSPALRSFEERRANPSSGYFMGEDELRKQDDKSIAGIILQRVPGIRLEQTIGSKQALASTRKSCAGPAFSRTTRNACVPCYVTVYLDGQIVYKVDAERDQNRTSLENQAFDVASVGVKEIAGVEFYPSTGTAPPQFNATGPGCGVLLLWSRER